MRSGAVRGGDGARRAVAGPNALRAGPPRASRKGCKGVRGVRGWGLLPARVGSDGEGSGPGVGVGWARMLRGLGFQAARPGGMGDGRVATGIYDRVAPAGDPWPGPRPLHGSRAAATQRVAVTPPGARAHHCRGGWAKQGGSSDERAAGQGRTRPRQRAACWPRGRAGVATGELGRGWRRPEARGRGSGV